MNNDDFKKIKSYLEMSQALDGLVGATILNHHLAKELFGDNYDIVRSTIVDAKHKLRDKIIQETE